MSFRKTLERSRYIANWATPAIGVCLLTGCAADGSSSVAQTEPQAEAVTSAAEEEPEATDDAIAQAMAGYADLGLLDLARTETPTERRMREEATARRAEPDAVTSTPVISEADAGVEEPAEPVVATPPTTAELLATVAGRVAADARTSGDPEGRAMVLALAAGLSPAGVNPTLDQLIEQDLSPGEAGRVRRIRELAGRIGDGSGGMLIEELRLAADELSSQKPVKIAKGELCWEIRGFGMYEPLDRNVFLAGNTAPVGLYVEVERADRERETGEDGAERSVIRLRQRISLFHDSDGLLAWNGPEETVLLSSRTPLRDVSLATAVQLPRSLTVGRYRMKIRVDDLIGGGTDELVIPLDVVADARIVGSATGMGR